MVESGTTLAVGGQVGLGRWFGGGQGREVAERPWEMKRSRCPRPSAPGSGPRGPLWRHVWGRPCPAAWWCARSAAAAPVAPATLTHPSSTGPTSSGATASRARGSTAGLSPTRSSTTVLKSSVVGISRSFSPNSMPPRFSALSTTRGAGLKPLPDVGKASQMARVRDRLWALDAGTGTEVSAPSSSGSRSSARWFIRGAASA